MNFKEFFELTTRINQNGKKIGALVNEQSEELRELAPLMRERFNRFSKDICPNGFEMVNLRNLWSMSHQDGLHYKSYYWNKFKPNNTNEEDLNGISIWIGVDYKGIAIHFGTTNNFIGDRVIENRFINEKYGFDVDEIFFRNGIRNDNIISKFIKNESFEITGEEEYPHLYYLYVGDNEDEDIEYFKIISNFTAQKFFEYIEEKKDKNMLDYNGYKVYLQNLGFAANGINTYLSYISENKIDILNSIESYNALSPKEKIMKFSNESTEFREEFDQYHNYAANTTFNDLRSGARRYKYYLQYQEIIKSMKDYDTNPDNFDLNGAHNFYEVFSNGKEYPVKAICRKNLNILELNDDFTTDNAKLKLKNIFNMQNQININFIDKNETVIIDGPIPFPANPMEHIFDMKNLILYGAPGVGKTYNYYRLISLLEEGKKEKEVFGIIKSNEFTLNVDEFYQRAEYEGRIEFITFHQSFGYEDFIEGFRPNDEGKIQLEDGIFKSICLNAKQNPDKNFYLVIDEINRGNISKIFGELITLIEESKRGMGDNNKYKCTLPYSKKPFSVPVNLYIIGTMNTTDKSIALIDVALRRRFTFIKMKPNFNLVVSSFKDTFEKLNDQIKKDLGEEYQIGHSYFMNIDETDLEFVKEYKIKPLLEEYYYGNADGLIKALEIIGFEENND